MVGRIALSKKFRFQTETLPVRGWKTDGPGRIFREWRQLSDAIAAPSTNALKQSSWYRIRVTRSALSARLR
jgi:hypothetical protein